MVNIMQPEELREEYVLVPVTPYEEASFLWVVEEGVSTTTNSYVWTIMLYST